MAIGTILLENVKDSDGWMGLVYDIFSDKYEKEGLSEDDLHDKLHNKANSIFHYGEYTDLEIEVDENLNIVGGRIIPFKNQ